MQKFFKRYRVDLLVSLIFLVILEGGAYWYFSNLKSEKIASFEKRSLSQNKLLVDTVSQGLQKRADLIFDLQINQPSVLSLMAQANDPKLRNIARKELYTQLLPKYKTLQRYGLRQLQFHLPKSVSFLRLHKPHSFGDSLKGIRYSIDLVNETKKVARGFEEGRIFNGFRNVYPLFYKGEFVGTVEISFSIDAIAKTLEQNKQNFYGLLIKKNLVQQKVWKENRKYYLESLLSKDYLWDKKAFSSLQHYTDTRMFLDELRSIEKTLQKHAAKKLDANKSFLLPCSTKRKNYVIVFLVLKNIAHKPVGYIVKLERNDFFAQTKHFDATTLLLTMVSNFILVLLLFLFLKTERDAKEALILRSNYDPLTNLLNRRGFETSYKTAFTSHKRKKAPFSLLFLDIDHFKKINDTYGHDIGDIVLKKLAQILKSNLRESDIIARWGGEEFVIVLNDTSAKAAKEVAQKLRKAIENFSEKPLPKFTISIGVTDGSFEKSLDELVKEADTALYEAKKSGRNKVVVYES